MRFIDQRRVIEARRLAEVVPALQAVEKAVQSEGLFAAGMIAYEAAPAFDRPLSVRPDGDFPLLWFGLYQAMEPLERLPEAEPLRESPGPWRPSVDEAHYWRAIEEVRRQIEQGETYQVNYSLRLRSAFKQPPYALFRRMVADHKRGYGAYLDLGRFALCSASPELFFRLEGDRLTARPMKGTAARGRTNVEDERQARWLHESAKNRAENVMIVDMIRNDLGRIATPGSVRVTELFAIERYATLWQMTSTVEARSRATLAEVMAALFPCASITGAPKVSTMEIIARLETLPRRIYTGTLGWIAPGATDGSDGSDASDDRGAGALRAQFNVAIRTALVDRQAESVEYGVGGGIVWDSRPSSEYQECVTKAKVLTQPRPRFDLLESLRWTPDEGYFLLEEHLRRLAAAAHYFAFDLDLTAVRKELMRRAQGLPRLWHKVRLLVARDGGVRCQATAMEATESGTASPAVRLRLAAAAVDASDPFLFHKTTHRAVYERAMAQSGDCDEVLLFNQRGELTEGTRFNLVVERSGRRLTPPVECGLLAGTFRGHLLERGDVEEAVLRRQDLERAEAIFLINSVRGWMKARWIEPRAVAPATAPR